MKKQSWWDSYYYFLMLPVTLLILGTTVVFYLQSPINPKASKTFYFFSSNIEDIATSLEEAGYTLTWLDKLVMQTEALPKQGWYHIEPQEKIQRVAFFKNLYQQHAKTMKIRVYAGESACEITRRLAKDIKLNAKALLEIYRQYALFEQGDILANTYTIARAVDELTLISYLFEASQRRLFAYMKQENQDATIEHLRYLLTIASIIQKESNNSSEMSLIASVIQNRLKKGMKLQMDGTLNYGKFSHSVVTSERIKNDNSRYNTYKYKGLPPAPMGSVSISAFKAALYPAKSSYLFFMLQPKGGHRFATTYKEHLKNIRIFRASQKKAK